MGIKVDSKAVLKNIQRIRKRYDRKGASRVEVGVTDPEIAKYATYVEFGWAQRVTAKQSLYLSNAIGKPVPRGGDGKFAWDEAAIKPGTALVNPPRPFLRGTLAAEGKKWLKALKTTLKLGDAPMKALATVGVIAQQDITETIARGGTSKEKFPERSELTMAILDQAQKGRKRPRGKNVSATSATNRTQPLVLTGRLLNAIRFDVK